MARIAVLGWGSLIWCPRELDTTTKWRPGPALPVEFARKSKDGRVTLVLVGEHTVHTFWALSAKDDIEGSCENLRQREGKPRPGDIHYTTGHGLRTCRDEEPSLESRDVSGTVSEWLSTMPDLDAVVWTGLPPKGFTPLDQPGLAKAVVDYLFDLSGEPSRRAKEYVQFAPAAIRTPVREAIEDAPLVWLPKELPRGLFEDATG